MERSNRVLKAVGAWFFLVVLTIAAAVVTIALVNKYQYGPETEVKAYFDALQAGNGGKALGLLRADVPDSNAALLNGKPLKTAAEQITDLKISTVSAEAQHAVVRAEYTLRDEPRSSEFTLHPAQTQWGFFTVWDFDRTTLPTMGVSMPGSTAVDINGESVALPGSERDFAVFYPGVYIGSYTSPMVSAPPRETLVTGADDPTELTLTPEASDALTSEVAGQARAYLDKCASRDALYPAGCPFSYDFPGRVQGDVTWTITDYPRPAVRLGEPRPDSWSVADSKGRAKVEFTAVNLFDGKTTPVSATVPFTFSADLSVSKDHATLTPRP